MKENKYLQWLSSTESIYWNDSAQTATMTDAFKNGAVGATTNPFLVHMAMKNETSFWEEKLAKKTFANTDERAEEVTKTMVKYWAEEFKDTYKENPATQGYICAQTNPKKTGDAKYMIEQAKRFAQVAENVVIKLPATSAGLEAYEECAALGLNVAATLSMSVAQVLATGEAAERGKKRAIENGIKPGLSIAVFMTGRLDNYLRDVAEDSKLNVKESEIIQAGTACIKRAYQIFNERKYDTYIMPAGSFNAANITDLAGAKMIMSIAPWIADLLADVEVFEENIHKPVDKNVIESLMQIPEFKKAYEPDGMKKEDFITFGGNNRTTAQYIECGWNLI